MADFPGIGHVALTVTNLQTSAEWYRRLFELEPVLDEDTGVFHHIIFILPGGGAVSLHGHATTDTSNRFSEFRAGLDHLAFHVANRTELEAWTARLDKLGIEHGEIVDAHYGSGLSFRDPDNIALEFFALPS
ncbi:MAG TPA: VOC family protein [Actinomycetota bacterium]|jgi:catechol 2,3-dioxygenase-like lactoylglutathione lyase family enzyme|nr:VOC family protein [Actinomycetota bacterium]